MMHALPARREALFVSHYLAGLSFLLLPHLAVYALTVAVEAALGCLELGPLTTWLLTQSGVCLFFYSFAVFCAMFTGNLVALPVFYGILNFLAHARDRPGGDGVQPVSVRLLAVSPAPSGTPAPG